tara:strand:+ start:5441 stop:6154 length:714 start_codon:yes stop_codon:yes gene_type:complete
MKYTKNHFWAFIPARSGSKTIRNKNLLKINKLPLIAYSIRAALNCKLINKVFFSSDSKKYLNLAKSFGCKNLILRDKKFAQDKSSDLDVFKDFINLMIKKNHQLPEFIIHLRPTTPIRKNNIITKAINIFQKKKQKYTALRSISTMSNPSYKTFRIRKQKLCSISKVDYDLDKYNLPKEMFEKTYFPNGYVDIFKTKNIFKNYLHGNKVYPFIVNEYNSDIDNLDDFKKLKKILNDE